MEFILPFLTVTGYTRPPPLSSRDAGPAFNELMLATHWHLDPQPIKQFPLRTNTCTCCSKLSSLDSLCLKLLVFPHKMGPQCEDVLHTVDIRLQGDNMGKALRLVLPLGKPISKSELAPRGSVTAVVRGKT